MVWCAFTQSHAMCRDSLVVPAMFVNVRAGEWHGEISWTLHRAAVLDSRERQMANKYGIAHAQEGDGHLVAAQLRVLICKEPTGGYVAQGLDIDYCATGSTVEQVQERFVSGFVRTIETLLRKDRPLGALFKSKTPPDVWQSYMDSARQDELTCATFVDLSDRVPAGLPFQSLAFCSPRRTTLR